VLYKWAQELGLIRKPAAFISTISDERGQELLYAGMCLRRILGWAGLLVFRGSRDVSVLFLLAFGLIRSFVAFTFHSFASLSPSVLS